MEKVLGKIECARFGLGGYQDACIGLHVALSFGGSGTSRSECAWDYEIIKPSSSSAWTEEDRTEQYAAIVRKISTLLNQAKVDSVEKLAGTPIEATMEDMSVKDWRILTEVI